MKQINVLWVYACIINHIFVKIIRMPVLDVSCYSLNLRCNNVVIYLNHSISVLKVIPWCKHIALIQDDFLPRTATPLVSWCKHCCNNSFFWVDPGQPIWPVTRSLDRVNDRVGFQNYEGDDKAFHKLAYKETFLKRSCMQCDMPTKRQLVIGTNLYGLDWLFSLKCSWSPYLPTQLGH